jgi:hypothetical protein
MTQPKRPTKEREISTNKRKHNQVVSDLQPGDHVRKHNLFNIEFSKGTDLKRPRLRVHQRNNLLKVDQDTKLCNLIQNTRQNGSQKR